MWRDISQPLKYLQWIFNDLLGAYHKYKKTQQQPKLYSMEGTKESAVSPYTSELPVRGWRHMSSYQRLHSSFLGFPMGRSLGQSLGLFPIKVVFCQNFLTVKIWHWGQHTQCLTKKRATGEKWSLCPGPLRSEYTVGPNPKPSLSRRKECQIHSRSEFLTLI